VGEDFEGKLKQKEKPDKKTNMKGNE